MHRANERAPFLRSIDAMSFKRKREYGDCICEVESASFTPLIFSTTGGMGREGLTFYRHLAELLSRCDATTVLTVELWHGFVALCLFHC